MSDRPDKETALRTLRGFQKRTVEHVVERLLDETGSQRFLVADEVGLGKTLVARGVIAEFIDHHWDSRRIDIIYMCSNGALARENLRKLRTVGDDQSRATAATRLTLLARNRGDEARMHPQLNFISLTPDTAIRTRGTGIHEERQVLFHLMTQMRDVIGEGRWLSNFLRGHVENERWRRRLKEDFDGDDSLAEDFRRRLAQDQELLRELEFMREAYVRVDSIVAQESQGRAGQLIGRLRNLLAQVCIHALEPDLVILDEFQRFKNLLVTGEQATEESELASQLFHYETPEKGKVALLLLSATPYRMFTTSDESASEDHHADFVETVRFLLNDEVKFSRLKTTLADYRRELLRATSGMPSNVPTVRMNLERQLLQVMSRHERVGSTEERDAMVTEPKVLSDVRSADVAQYLALSRVREHLDCRDLTELWKSSPYLLNFAKTYEFKTSLEEQLRNESLRDVFEQSAKQHLNQQELREYQQLDPGNGRLRTLAKETLDGERWRMLWLPPSRPYWPLGGPWKDNAGFTKKLLFSAWNVVPDAVSALLSYEVERRMVGDAPMARGVPYEDYYRKRAELLRFTVRAGKPAGMNTLALQIPCLALSNLHPLETPGVDARAEMRPRVEALLQRLQSRVSSDVPDRAWYWAAPLLLDDPTEMSDLLETLGRGDDYDETEEPSDESDLSEEDMHARRRGSTGISVHGRRALEVVRGEYQLGAFPEDLLDVLIEHALGNPAVLWARALAGFGVADAQRRELAHGLGDAFRSLFNEPPVIEMLHRGDDEAYWRTVLNYSVEGNLQAVLDEYAHQLWEPEAWGDATIEAIAQTVTNKAAAAITTKTSRVRPDYYRTRPRSIAIDRKGLAVRIHFALRYGSLQGSGEASEVREDVVRDAFKSPFYPFVLASTSVGQEGLDFHPWCHAVWHWNLPGNPVDLEQREGRVHRYKGHAVRKNIAELHGTALRSSWTKGEDPWSVLFRIAEAAARAAGAPELVPCWIAPGSTKVQRCVPMLPFSRELDKLENLKRSLAIYRVVFGQPRQEELTKLLHAGEVSTEELESWVVRLVVPEAATKMK